MNEKRGWPVTVQVAQNESTIVIEEKKEKFSKLVSYFLRGVIKIFERKSKDQPYSTVILN